MEEADGAYSEPLGIITKKFVETKTKEFLDYFIYEPLLTDEDFNNWARFVAGEIKIIAENKENEETNRVGKIMISNCLTCNEKQKDKLESFLIKIACYCR